jgi:hypothetical protein
MRRSVLALLALLIASRAYAQVVEGSITSILSGRSDPRDGNIYTVLPLYEGLRLTLRDVSVPYVDDLRLEVSGWLGGFFVDPVGGQRFGGDLDVAYLEGKLVRRHILVRVGRQNLIGGAARFTHLDGASITFSTHGAGLTVFGGVPVVPRFGVKVGDATAGGRVFYRFSYASQLGVSFVHIEDLGRTGRSDAAIDFRTQPIRMLTLTGIGVLSLVERDLAEVDVAATLQPYRLIDVRVDYRDQRPDLFISRSSIFAVFSNSTRQEVGGTIEGRALGRITVDGDYHAIFEPAGAGHRAGVKCQLKLGPSGELTVGAAFHFLRLPDNGYYETRVFGMLRITPRVLLTLDGDAYIFDALVNGHSYSLTGATALAWDFTKVWRAVASAAVSTTPFVNGGYDFMVKLAYNPTFRFHERH